MVILKSKTKEVYSLTSFKFTSIYCPGKHYITKDEEGIYHFRCNGMAIGRIHPVVIARCSVEELLNILHDMLVKHTQHEVDKSPLERLAEILVKERK